MARGVLRVCNSWPLMSKFINLLGQSIGQETFFLFGVENVYLDVFKYSTIDL